MRGLFHRVVAKRCAAQIFASSHCGCRGSAPAAHRAGDSSFIAGLIVSFCPVENLLRMVSPAPPL